MKLRTKLNKEVKRTKQDKLVKQRFDKKAFVKLLGEAEKYPLSRRIAAELFRGGVSGRKFLESFHIEGNTFSGRILEEMTQFDLEKGYDPNGIPPVLPQFLRYASTAQIKEAKAKKGRPNKEQAQAYLKKVLKDCLDRGWDEVDFIVNLRELVDGEGEAKKVVLDEDLDSPEKPKKAKGEKAYFTRIGNKWQRFPSQGEAVLAMENDDSRILGPVEVPEPGIHCAYCKFRLNGTVVTVRTPVPKKVVEGKPNKKAKSKKAEKLEYTIDHMHMGCYWMEVAHAAQIPLGMQVLSAPDGIYYVFHGMDKGGWKKKEADEAQVNTGDNSDGVSTPEGAKDKQAEVIPAEKAAG